MAIGKFLQLYRNASTNMATSLADADTMIKGTAANLQDGSPVIVRYTDETNVEHALLGVKGVDGNVHYVELSKSKPITNKRLAEEFKKLTVSVVAAEAGENDAKVIVTPTGSDEAGYTYTVGLENVASTLDVQTVQDNVNKIGLTSDNNATTTTYTFTNGKGEETTFSIDKDSSLVSVKLGNGGEGTFQEDTKGQVLEFVYEVSDTNEQVTKYVDFGHVITDAEFSALVGDGLTYTNSKLNVEVDGTYVKVVDDKVTIDVAALGTELVKDGESAINGAIDTKINALNADEITKAGEVIVAVSQTDGIVSAKTGKVDGANVTFTKSDSSAIKATDVSSAIMEMEKTINDNQASALGITSGNGIAITGEGNVKTISVKLNETANNALELDGSGLSVKIAEGATNGTIAVNGTDVAVHGLGSAAYTESSAYESAGAIDEAIAKLDAEVEYKAADAKGLVESVEVTQVNGVITSVSIVEGNTWDCGTFGSNNGGNENDIDMVFPTEPINLTTTFEEGGENSLYPEVANTLKEMYNKLNSKYGDDFNINLVSGDLVYTIYDEEKWEDVVINVNVKGSNWFDYLSNIKVYNRNITAIERINSNLIKMSVESDGYEYSFNLNSGEFAVYWA